MDSFEFNKIAGAVLFCMLVLAGISNLGNILVSPTKLKEPVLKIAVTETEGKGAAKEAAKPAEAEKPLPVLLAAADAKKGEGVAKKCAVCHNFKEGAGAKIGPDLWNIVGRKKAAAAGFAYSDAMKGKGGDWGYQELFDYLKDPKAYVPGNKMAFAGLPKAEERAEMLAYLRTLSENPVPLPK